MPRFFTLFVTRKTRLYAIFIYSEGIFCVKKVRILSFLESIFLKKFHFSLFFEHLTGGVLWLLILEK